MALLNSYQNTFAAYSLRKTYSSYSGPLIRLYRDFDAVEADVFADQNGEVSFDSPISVGKQSSSAVVLGEFVGKSGYRNPDSLMSLSVGRISKIYDQSVNANHFLSSTVAKMPLLFDASGTEEIYKINDAPAYFVSQGMNNTLNEGIQLPDVGVEFSMYLSARSSSATPTAFGFSVHDTSNFIIFPNISFFYNSKIISSSPDYYVLNNVRYNTRQGEVYSATQYELPVVPSDGVYLFSLNVVRPDTNENQLFPETQKVTPWNGHIYSDVIIYEGYDPQRDYAVESFMADEFQAVATKALVEQSTPDGFLTQFPNAAAAYSVRSLRGLTGLNGPKVLRVRREVDNAEVDVYTDSTGWVSLDSPVVIVPAITGQIDGGTGVEIESLANTLGEFVADADYSDVDSLGSPTTAKVVVWYDQSSADYTIISEEIDARGAPVRIRVVGGTYDAYEFDLYFDDNESISLSSYVADTYEISDGATQVTANLTLGTLQTLVDAGMTEARVCVWYDQSGNANDATQTTTGNQPKIYDSTGGVIEDGSAGNEKPALSFDISNAKLKSNFTPLSQPSHVFSVCNRGANANSYIFDSYDLANRTYNVLAGSVVELSAGSSYQVLSSISGTNLHSSLINGASSVMKINGSTIGTSGNTGTNSFGGITLGNRYSTFDVRISLLQELILYNENKSTSGDDTGIEATINNYYDIYGTGNTGGNIKTLDVFPDAAAAYSLRKLRTSYNGPVNLSKRKDAIQNVSTAQPTIYNGGLITENSRGAIYFNTTSKLASTNVSSFDNTNEFSAFTVLSPKSLTSFGFYYSLTDENGGDIVLNYSLTELLTFAAYIPLAGPRINYKPIDLSQYIFYTQAGASARLDINEEIHTGTVDISAFSKATILEINNKENLEGDANYQELIFWADTKQDDVNDIKNNINSAFQIYAANFSSVLDTVPLAKAAYSIRRLTKNYIGPIITVTNGSTTKDFYADFWGNLNSDALTEFANGGTLSVTRWWDQSGKNNHLESTANHPTLNISNGVVTGVTVNSTNGFDVAQIITDMNAVTTGSKQLIAVTSTIDDTIDLNTTSYTDLKEIIYYT